LVHCTTDADSASAHCLTPATALTGGALFLGVQSKTTITSCTFQGNTANAARAGGAGGGAIFLAPPKDAQEEILDQPDDEEQLPLPPEAGTLTMVDCKFIENVADRASAVKVDHSNIVAVRNTEFRRHKGEKGLKSVRMLLYICSQHHWHKSVDVSEYARKLYQWCHLTHLVSHDAQLLIMHLCHALYAPCVAQ
jgi:hypothetical protein